MDFKQPRYGDLVVKDLQFTIPQLSIWPGESTIWRGENVV